ncbi:hypothetical protein AAMO2058_000098000 [Amorphochlora amoebiformis]
MYGKKEGSSIDIFKSNYAHAFFGFRPDVKHTYACTSVSNSGSEQLIFQPFFPGHVEKNGYLPDGFLDDTCRNVSSNAAKMSCVSTRVPKGFMWR